MTDSNEIFDSTRSYIGVKMVSAKPMTYHKFQEFKGLSCTRENSEGYIVYYPDGYIIWCPKEQFEVANRLTSAMPFGWAIEAAKKGCKIARAGWNGKGMWVKVSNCSGKEWTNAAEEIFMHESYLYMKTVQNTVIPWLASQADVLADDWQIVN